MSLDLDIQALLRTPQVQEINFMMRGIRVTGPGFADLSTCFSDHSIRHLIRVTVRPELVGPLDDALYDGIDDKINLRSDTVMATTVGRSHVVHECTHAQLDLRGRDTPIRSDESAAFIAEAWYLLASGESDTEIDRLSSSEIRIVASSLRNEAQATSGVVEVSADQINTVRSVMVRFRYGSGYYLGNGVGGHRFRAE